MKTKKEKPYRLMASVSDWVATKCKYIGNIAPCRLYASDGGTLLVFDSLALPEHYVIEVNDMRKDRIEEMLNINTQEHVSITRDKNEPPYDIQMTSDKLREELSVFVKTKSKYLGVNTHPIFETSATQANSTKDYSPQEFTGYAAVFDKNSMTLLKNTLPKTPETIFVTQALHAKAWIVRACDFTFLTMPIYRYKKNIDK